MRSYSDSVPQQEQIAKLDNLIEVLKQKENELEKRLDDQDALISKINQRQKSGAIALCAIFAVELVFLASVLM